MDTNQRIQELERKVELLTRDIDFYKMFLQPDEFGIKAGKVFTVPSFGDLKLERSFYLKNHTITADTNPIAPMASDNSSEDPGRKYKGYAGFTGINGKLRMTLDGKTWIDPVGIPNYISTDAGKVLKTDGTIMYWATDNT